MSENHENIPGKLIPNHDYDGIQELDNPLPKWWLYIFYGTIIFSIGYFYYYEIGDGTRLAEDFAADKAAHSEQFAKKKAEATATIDFAALEGNAELAAAGKAKFVQFCAACHLADGGGSIGPNLTDAHWIHGTGDAETIYKVINEGILAKGMPAWGQTFSVDDMKNVTAFVISLKGTTPANPKAPQGTKVE